MAVVSDALEYVYDVVGGLFFLDLFLYKPVQEHLAGKVSFFDSQGVEVVDVSRDLLLVGEGLANVYFDTKQPWVQRKTDLAACGTTMNVCIQTIKTLATIFAPFLPFSASKILAQLNIDETSLAWDQATVELAAGHQLGQPEVLFKKLDAAELFED